MFVDYFQSHYANRPQAWAHCYRKNCGINTNMHLERWHRTLKGIYLEGKNVKRLDKSLRGLMLFTTEQLFKRLRTLNFGAVSSKVSEMRKRHVLSQTLDLQFVEQSIRLFLVASEKSTNFYEVQFNERKCRCKLKCTDCAQCVHTVSCTCPDYLIRLNMCKHIHYLISKLPQRVESQMPSDALLDAPLAIAEPDETFHESEIYVSEISATNRKKAELDSTKEQLITKAISHLQSLSSQEEIFAATKIVNMIEPATIAANLTRTAVQSFKVKDTSPNRIAAKQPRYKSIKKKSKKVLRMTRTNDSSVLKMLLASNSSQSKV